MKISFFVLFLGLILGIIFFSPLPYYQSEQVICKMGQTCPIPGWHTRKSLFQEIISMLSSSSTTESTRLNGFCIPTYRVESNTQELTAEQNYSLYCSEKRSEAECLSVDVYNQKLDDFSTPDGFSDCKWNKSNVEGKFCGGIAANLPENQCPDGFYCKLDGKYPDASGVCSKRSLFNLLIRY